jgi:hypothetical protein
MDGGSTHGLIEILSCHLPGGTEENYGKKKTPVRISGMPTRDSNHSASE